MCGDHWVEYSDFPPSSTQQGGTCPPLVAAWLAEASDVPGPDRCFQEEFQVTGHFPRSVSSLLQVGLLLWLGYPVSTITSPPLLPPPDQTMALLTGSRNNVWSHRDINIRRSAVFLELPNQTTLQAAYW